MVKKKKTVVIRQRNSKTNPLKTLIKKMEEQLSDDVLEKIKEYHNSEKKDILKYDFYYTSAGTGDTNAQLQ